MKKTSEDLRVSVLKYEDIGRVDEHGYWLIRRAFEDAGMDVMAGTQVEPTEWAIQNGVAKRGDVGVVFATPRKHGRLCVLVNGKRTPVYYWSGFWKSSPPVTPES